MSPCNSLPLIYLIHGPLSRWIIWFGDFMSKLIHGDLVLADRGFEIQDLVAIAGAEVQYPAFTRGKGQLSATEVEADMCFCC